MSAEPLDPRRTRKAQVDGLELLNPLRLAARIKGALELRLYGETFWALHGKVEAAFRKLSIFVPNSRGSREDLYRLTLQAAEQTFPHLAALVEAAGTGRAVIVEAESFCRNDAERVAAGTLKQLLDKHGSDKATLHNYHLVYASIMKRDGDVRSILEIGLGTNNEDTVSHMGAVGKPGASLRAFSEFLPEARIHGADYDRRILFQEGRIRTSFVDQTDLASFAELEALDPFDIIIDDGLHSPNANLAVLLFGLRRINRGGWIVIEDIPDPALPLWQVVGAILPPAWEARIVRTTQGLMFLAQRVA